MRRQIGSLLSLLVCVSGLLAAGAAVGREPTPQPGGIVYTRPDLVIKAVTPVTSDWSLVNVTVTNVGTWTAAASTLRVYSFAGCLSAVISYVATPALKPGQSVVLRASVRARPCQLNVQADWYNDVKPESNEQNNGVDLAPFLCFWC